MTDGPGGVHSSVKVANLTGGDSIVVWSEEVDSSSTGNSGIELVWGNIGNDVIDMSANVADLAFIIGDYGENIVYGTNGVDVIIGGFNDAWGTDIIADWQASADSMVFDVDGLTNSSQLGYTYDSANDITTLTYNGNLAVAYGLVTLADISVI